MKSILCFFMLISTVAGQCVGPTCPLPYSGIQPSYSKVAPNYSKSPAAACKIANRTKTGIAHGTGILVEKNETAGLVLTTAHTFSERGSITVTFPDGKTYKARIESIDHTWDLAALVIANPSAKPIKLASLDPRIGDRVFAGGFGGNDRWAWVSGPVRGYVSPAGSNQAQWLAWQGRARAGDSGGPVVNDNGELVAIVSGTDTQPGRLFSTGPFFYRIRIFLKRLRERFRIRPPRQPNPIRSQPIPPTIAPPSKPDIKLSPPAKSEKQPNEKTGDGQLVGPSMKLPESPKKIPEIISQLPTEVKASFWGLIGKAFGSSAMTAATVASGGTGAIGASLALWAFNIWRRRRKRKGAATYPADRFREAISPKNLVPAIHPRQMAEAREFLQLSELEGRDPLYDGLVGRLTLDTLQESIDGQNKEEATFARELKSKLETQVNQMIPLAV